MRVVIQRVSEASVVSNGELTATIGQGLMILIGIEEADTIDDCNWLCAKIIKLRIFNDADGVMNLSLLDIGGDIIVVSQFTLHAATKKGNRPSYIKAARPEIAVPLYESFIAELGALTGRKIGAGIFGADMKVSLINDGPVTILMDSKNRE